MLDIITEDTRREDRSDRYGFYTACQNGDDSYEPQPITHAGDSGPPIAALCEGLIHFL
jgi:hypothetical protein